MSGKKCGFRDASEISIRKTFNDHPEFRAKRLGALVARLLATGNKYCINCRLVTVIIVATLSSGLHTIHTELLDSIRPQVSHRIKIIP
jgi:hypothetical protein